MSDRVLRGSRLGTSSYEDDREIAPAPRQSITYECPEGHRVELPFSAEAEIPAAWECPRCGANAIRLDVDQPEAKHAKPPRTHWDMLLERRSLSDLEDLLSERLQLLRAGEIGPPPVADDTGAASGSGNTGTGSSSGQASSGSGTTGPGTTGSGNAASKKRAATKSTATAKSGPASKASSGTTGAKDSEASESSGSSADSGTTGPANSGGGKHRKSA